MPFTLVVTTAGRAQVINPANTGTLAATITEVGVSATAIAPAVGTAALPGEIKRLTAVGGSVVADDTIHIDALDESTDSYTCRSVALYLGNGTLFAVGSDADPLFNKAAGSNGALALDIVLADIAAPSITFGATNFMDGPATTERSGLVELATTAEAAAGIDALRALTPAGAKAAILGWLLTQDGSGSGLDADLLDGQDGAYYANIAARLGFTPVNKGGDIMGGALALESGSTVKDASGNAYGVGYRDIPQNSKSAAYTLALTDAGKHVYHPAADATARVWTIPANAAVAFPIGTAITFVNDAGAGAVTIAITSDTLVMSPGGGTGSRTLYAGGMATAVKVSATRWVISGSGLS